MKGFKFSRHGLMALLAFGLVAGVAVPSAHADVNTQTYRLTTHKKKKKKKKTGGNNGNGSISKSTAPGVDVEDAFADPNPTGPEKLIASINDPSTQSIEMWMYSMSDPNVVNALLAAGSRGVSVTIIFDKGMFTGSDASVVSALSGGQNINVVQATSAFSLTHAKTMLVNADRPDGYVWIMSMNTTTAYTDEADFAIRTSDAQVMADLRNLFQVDLQNAQDSGSAEPSSLSSPNIVLSPNNSLDQVVALINSAQKSVDLTVENLGYYPATKQYPQAFTQIVDALVAKAKQGVNVRVIAPGCDENSDPGFNMAALNAINKAVGKTVAKMMSYPATPEKPYMHQKLIIVDNARFFIGSVNFSINSLEKSREIGVIAKLEGPATLVEQEFNTEYSEAVTPVTSDKGIPKNCQAF